MDSGRQKKNGIENTGTIGASGYPMMFENEPEMPPETGSVLKQIYGKRVMNRETVHTHALRDADAANNKSGPNALFFRYKVSPEGQRQNPTDPVQSPDEDGAEDLIIWNRCAFLKAVTLLEETVLIGTKQVFLATKFYRHISLFIFQQVLLLTYRHN